VTPLAIAELLDVGDDVGSSRRSTLHSRFSGGRRRWPGSRKGSPARA